MTLISVVMPTYNSALLVERALNSVIRQHGSFELEIVVVDDCSTDNTLDVIAKMNIPNLRLIKMKENSGAGASRGRGIMEARGDYLAFLDSDDYWHDDFICKTFNAIKAHPEAVAVFTGQCHKTLEKKDSIRPRCVLNSSSAEMLFINDLYKFWAENAYPVCTGSVLMKRSVAVAMGGQRPDLRVSQDLEFWLLVATQGPWVFVPEVLFTSDGMQVTARRGWLEKNKKRWASAPTMKDWERRILAALPENKATSYNMVRGEIAMMVQYCMIASGRDRLALENQREFSCYYKTSRITSLYKLCSLNFLTWKMLCLFLRYREYHRKIS